MSRNIPFLLLDGCLIGCFIGFLITCLPGCDLLPRDPLPAIWFYTHSYSGASKSDNELTPAHFIEFRTDGSYTRDWGHFDHGTWKKTDKKIVLTDDHRQTHTLTVNSVNSEEMEITREGGSFASFERLKLPREADDPFGLRYNHWRIKPDHKESDAEIRKRLYEHCRFWEAYFNWALKYELSSVDVRSTPTAIKIWGNGFTLKPFEDLPDEWRSYFFDEEDCRKANAIIADIFHNKTIAWAHTDSKYKLFIGAFQQLGNYLR